MLCGTSIVTLQGRKKKKEKYSCRFGCETHVSHAEVFCLACRDMLDASPGVSWDDIAGLAEAKRVLQENVILPLYMPEYFQGIRRPVKVCSLENLRLKQIPEKPPGS